MNRGFRCLLALGCGALTLGTGALLAQKPKSPKEVAAIQAVQAAQTPDERVKAIENVLTNFADTEFKTVLLQMAMQSEEQKGDFAQTIFYAQRLLDADKKNAFAMVTLASQTATHTREFDLDKDEKLAKVDKWAKDAIEAAKTMPKPRPDYPDDQWENARKDVQSQAYDAMGAAALLRKKYDDAIADFKQSTTVAATPDPASYIRLGQAYLDAGNLEDADKAFDQAVSAPNASAQIKTIAQGRKQEVAKRKAGGAQAKP